MPYHLYHLYQQYDGGPSVRGVASVYNQGLGGDILDLAQALNR
jgi:hypothetical protein